MKIVSRIKRLERKLLGNKELWAVFTVGCYEDPRDVEIAKQRLLDQYTAQGNPRPTHFLFIKEVPRATKRDKEAEFLYSFSY